MARLWIEGGEMHFKGALSTAARLLFESELKPLCDAYLANSSSAEIDNMKLRDVLRWASSQIKDMGFVAPEMVGFKLGEIRVKLEDTLEGD